MRNLLVAVAFTWLVGSESVAWCWSSGDELSKHPVPAATRALIDLLPPDTQTLRVANGPFVLFSDPEKPLDNAESQKLSATDLYREIRSYLMGPLGILDQYCEPLVGHRVDRVVFGSRRFRPPNDIGTFQYEGCALVQFPKESAPDIATVMAALHESAVEGDLQLGHRVAVFRKQEYLTERNYFVVNPRPSMILVATDVDYLQEVLRRLHPKSKVEEFAFPKTLPEWKYVDTQANVWGMRHYDSHDVDEDTTTPLNKFVRSLPGRSLYPRYDAAAIGFTFDFREGDEGKLRIRQLTNSERPLGSIADEWSIQKHSPKVNVIQAGVYEIEYHLQDDDALSYFWWLITSRLGHSYFI